jgi:hypothetical protein
MEPDGTLHISYPDGTTETECHRWSAGAFGQRATVRFLLGAD